MPHFLPGPNGSQAIGTTATVLNLSLDVASDGRAVCSVSGDVSFSCNFQDGVLDDTSTPPTDLPKCRVYQVSVYQKACPLLIVPIVD